MGRKRKNPKYKQTDPKWYQKEDNYGNFVFDWALGLSGEAWREIFSVLILLLSVIMLLGFFGSAGSIGTGISNITKKIFGGFGSFIFTVTFFYLGLMLLLPGKEEKKEGSNKQFRVSKFLGIIIFILAFPTFLHLFSQSEGGSVGLFFSDILKNSIGLFPSFLVSVFAICIAVMMVFNFSIIKYLSGGDDEEDGVKINNQGGKVSVFDSVMKRVGQLKKKPHIEIESKAPVLEVDARGTGPVIKKDSTWEYPSIDMLQSADEAPNPGNINKNVEIIQKGLETFGIDITMSDVNVGPTVTQYTFKPREGVKLNQIIARQTDLALALSAKSLRMEAPIPGKSSVGIEIPNIIPAKVTIKEVLKSKHFKAVKSKLALALGRDVSGDPTAIDLEKMPHLLIAGSTGSGKSVCINAIICSLLFNNSPRDLRLMLVDPKRVELTGYNGIPHLLTPVITEVDHTVSALKWAVSEMERRYRMFADQGKRNITAYNAEPGPEGKLPYVVIIVDELADLMATSAKEVEGSIVRLAQMARATGMHLILATQRPSVDVLTGLIKANVSSRIAFATASQVDSRTILDMSGAEKLLGNGDMLFIGNGVNKPKRIQGCYVSDKEIDDLNKFLRDKGEAVYDESILSFRSNHGGGVAGGGDGAEEDDMYNLAVEEVCRAGKASASLLQRRLRVGYARAARLLDLMEGNGVIGSADGAKPRDVLISNPGDLSFHGNSPENGGGSNFGSGSNNFDNYDEN